MRQYNKAFTLAEVLITLGIIGIVAAMTIPTLMQKYNEKVTVTKVKKMYSTLSQAYLMNKAKDEIVMGNTQATGSAAATEIAQVFVPYLKISKNCGTADNGCVFTGSYKYRSGSTAAGYGSNGMSAYRVLLTDGSSIWFRRTSELTSTVFYDVNGPQAPNIWGTDLFYFQIVDDKVLPLGETGTYYDFDNACRLSTHSGLGCTAWLIRKGNMDYLHCDDLSWNGKQKCD